MCVCVCVLMLAHVCLCVAFMNMSEWLEDCCCACMFLGVFSSVDTDMKRERERACKPPLTHSTLSGWVSVHFIKIQT